MADSEELLRCTRIGELWRACCTRPATEALAGGGLVLLVAEQAFRASDPAKALLAAATYIGLLFGPLVVSLVASRAWRVSRALAVLLVLAAAGLALASGRTGLGDAWSTFLVGCLLAALAFSSCAPLVTALWRQNSPGTRRGRLFGKVQVISVGSAVLAGLAIARWMRDDAWRYQEVFAVLALLTLAASIAIARVPSATLTPSGSRNPLGCLGHLWRDRLFGYMSLAWMLMGIGNLATLPLRVEYVASGERGLGLVAWQVLLLIAVLPEICMLLAMLVWSRLFDHWNFMVLRMAINAFFVLSLVCFFGFGVPGVVIGGVLFGIAKGGGNIAWNLWVTKFAAPERTADYMATHTFLTGIRGILGPFLAFAAIGAYGPQSIAWTGAALILVATLMMLPVIRYGRR